MNGFKLVPTGVVMDVGGFADSLRCVADVSLKGMHEAVCEEYRRRLCGAWDIRFDYTWWIADIVGDELAFDDEFVLEMTEVKHCVDNGVTYEEFDEWWRFVMDEAHDGHERPRINFHSWFRGLRPEMLDRPADVGFYNEKDNRDERNCV